jgi:uncharacterized protein YdhG (YjbR/CyaY superfamily)
VARDPRVDAYLAALPDEQRAALEHVRTEIQRLVPEAVEMISYRMPAFQVGGRFFLSFAAWKHHCSLYPFTGMLPPPWAADLDAFRGSKGSLHFTPQRPLPDDLLAQVVHARLAGLEPPA